MYIVDITDTEMKIDLTPHLEGQIISVTSNGYAFVVFHKKQKEYKLQVYVFEDQQPISIKSVDLVGFTKFQLDPQVLISPEMSLAIQPRFKNSRQDVTVFKEFASRDIINTNGGSKIIRVNGYRMRILLQKYLVLSKGTTIRIFELDSTEKKFKKELKFDLEIYDIQESPRELYLMVLCVNRRNK